MKKLTSVFQYIIIGFLAISCSPKGSGINGLQVGGADATVSVGQSTLIEANINVDQPIDNVQIEWKSANDDGWELLEVYTEDFQGKTNAVFFESVSIPTDVIPGKYVLTMKVKQQDGTVVEQSMETTFTIDSTVPVASALDVGINAAGNDLHLESELTAVKKIEQVVVKVNGASWSKDFTFDSPKIKDQLSHTFHEHVHVDDAPAGEYQVILTVQDQEGRQASVEGKFVKK